MQNVNYTFSPYQIDQTNYIKKLKAQIIVKKLQKQIILPSYQRSQLQKFTLPQPEQPSALLSCLPKINTRQISPRSNYQVRIRTHYTPSFHKEKLKQPRSLQNHRTLQIKEIDIRHWTVADTLQSD